MLVFALPLGVVFFVTVQLALWRSRQAQNAAVLTQLALAAERHLPLADDIDRLAGDVGGRSEPSLRAVADELRHGASFADAVAAAPRIASPVERLTIQVGETTGDMPAALRVAARRQTDKLLRTPPGFGVEGTAIYLAAILLAMVSICGFIMYYIIPKFKNIFEDFDVELPQLTVLVITISDLFVNWWFLLIPASMAIFGLGAVWYLAATSARFSLSIPLLSWRPPRAAVPDLLRQLALGVAAKTPLEKVLATQARWHHSSGTRRRLDDARQDVVNGDNTWRALQGRGLLTPSERQLLESAERVGNLDWMLNYLADRLDRRRELRREWWFQFLRPWPVLAVAIFVGLFVIGLFLPLVKLINELS
ncbi:MAG: type II secretion system F family protein [Planctomycetaceae bacterium]